MFLFACSPAQQQNNKEQNSHASASDLPLIERSFDKHSSNLIRAPLLSLSELLHADDVRQGLAIAAQQNDGQALNEWQKILLAAAKEVNLEASDISLLSGPQGLVFLEFQGMKTNYQSEFDQAFFDFKDIDVVFQQYPAFKDLHKQSRELVRQRNALINRVTKELQENGFEGDAVAEAKLQWQNFMQTQQ